MSSENSKIYFKEPEISQWTRSVWDKDLARLVDDIASREFHVNPAALMETAGRAVAKVALERGAESHPVVVLSGPGNNGGDGLVAARVLFDHGVQVNVIVIAETSKTASSLFSSQKSALLEMKVPITEWTPGAIKALGLTKPIIIDAISGLGFTPPCSGVMLEALTEAGKIPDSTVIAIDIPSGVSADDGNVTSMPLKAHETVTFGASRPIHRLMPAAAHCGNTTVVDIGFPKPAVARASTKRAPIWQEVDPKTILEFDPWHSLPRTAHKYSRGHVLVIGGSPGKIGAPVMAGLASLRSGAGWCSIAIPRGEIPSDISIPMELTVENFFDGDKINSEQMSQFLLERKVQAVVVGPGWMKQCLDQAAMTQLKNFARQGGSVVFDAGALHDIAPMLIKSDETPINHFLLTPHPGEWVKITDARHLPPLNPAGVASANQLAQEIKSHILYKNSAPVIISPDGSPALICPSGSPSLARAGSGDLLAGIIAAHLAIGCSVNFAAARSYTLLSKAAWMAAQDVGDDAVLATDILGRLGIAARY